MKRSLFIIILILISLPFVNAQDIISLKTVSSRKALYIDTISIQLQKGTVIYNDCFHLGTGNRNNMWLQYHKYDLPQKWKQELYKEVKSFIDKDPELLKTSSRFDVYVDQEIHTDYDSKPVSYTADTKLNKIIVKAKLSDSEYQEEYKEVNGSYTKLPVYTFTYFINEKLAVEIKTYGLDYLKEIAEEDLNPLFSSLYKIAKGRVRASNLMKVNATKENINYNDDIKFRGNPSYYSDMIYIRAGFGVNLVKGKWLPSVASEIGVHWGYDKIYTRVFTNLEVMFDFEKDIKGTLQPKEYSFWGVGFIAGLSNNYSLGLGVAKLIDRKSNLFDKSTLRLDLYTKYKSFGFTPNVYFDPFGNSKSSKSYIGIKFSFDI
ncbi:MAG: hypothetical protein ACEPOV_00940 [Hyphomicrobiales bacterium]